MCTNFVVTATDGTVVNGRGMDFDDQLNSMLIVRAGGIPAHLTAFGLDVLDFTPTYNYVGMTAFGLALCTDGINSEGLSTGAMWLPGSEYQTSDGQGLKSNLFCALFVDWMLGKCRNVAEVRAALESGEIRVIGGDWVAEHLPLHFPVHDAAGNSIVIEFLEGKAVICDNPVGVLTNNPNFQWQLTNLQNYVSLTARNAEPVTLGSLVVQPTGEGSGLTGMPGDATPPSRFVRTAYLRQFALPPADADAAKSLSFHLLNGVEVIKGTTRGTGKSSIDHPDGAPLYDYTQWSVVKDMTNRTLTLRTYASPLAWEVDLKTLDFKTLNGKRFKPPGTFANPLPLTDPH